MIITGSQRNQNPNFGSKTPSISKGLGNVKGSIADVGNEIEAPLSAEEAQPVCRTPKMGMGNVKKCPQTPVEGTRSGSGVPFKS